MNVIQKSLQEGKWLILWDILGIFGVIPRFNVLATLLFGLNHDEQTAVCWFVILSHFHIGKDTVTKNVLQPKVLQIKSVSQLNLYSEVKFLIYEEIKSINLQYNRLGCLDHGTNESSTKRLMFQVLFFFMISCKILCKNPFNLFSYFLKKLQK